MFWSYKTLLLTMENQNIPILLKIQFLKKDDQNHLYSISDEDYLFYKNIKNRPSPIFSITDDLTKPAIIIQGIVGPGAKGEQTKDQWKESIQFLPLSSLILANAAAHKQYPDETKDSLFHEIKNNEYENFKIMANQIGFSRENPTFFLIQHVYSDQLEKYINSSAK
jgi:hypothetical protein